MKRSSKVRMKREKQSNEKEKEKKQRKQGSPRGNLSSFLRQKKKLKEKEENIEHHSTERYSRDRREAGGLSFCVVSGFIPSFELSSFSHHHQLFHLLFQAISMLLLVKT